MSVRRFLTDEDEKRLKEELSVSGEKGQDGKDGKDGKSAYEYAKDGGYTGSESDFAKKLAQESYSKTEIDTKFDNFEGGSVQSDWNQNDETAPDFIKNKPFGATTGTLLDTVFENVEDGNNVTEVVLLSSEGVNLTVSVNGVDYPVTVREVEFHGDSTLTVGNPYVYLEFMANLIGGTVEEVLQIPGMDVFNDNTGEPFLMIDALNSSTGVSEGTGFLFSLQLSGGVHIVVVGETLKKFSSKYIDWSDGNVPSCLPKVTTNDNGKVAMVVNGKWTAESLENGNEVAY